MKYYATDSNSLLMVGPVSLTEAESWLDERCIAQGKAAGDWRNPEFWLGCESAPSLYTEAEWNEMEASFE